MSVRIRRSAGAVPPAQLLTFDVDAWAPREINPGDPWRPTRAHQAWCEARAAWASQDGHAWPGGAGQREMQEAMSMPDEPWDGSDA